MRRSDGVTRVIPNGAGVIIRRVAWSLLRHWSLSGFWLKCEEFLFECGVPCALIRNVAMTFEPYCWREGRFHERRHASVTENSLAHRRELVSAGTSKVSLVRIALIRDRHRAHSVPAKIIVAVWRGPIPVESSRAATMRPRAKFAFVFSP